jgi:iron complex transport system permease protein
MRFVLLTAAMISIIILSFGLGRYYVPPGDLFRILLSHFADIRQTWSGSAQTMVEKIRIPRVLAAAVIGAALSTAGASYQGMFRNPMVSPDILGASSGAGFGAALAILLSFSYWGISLLSFAFGAAAVLAAYFISRVSRGNQILSMVLSGMVVSALFSAATSYIKLVADTDEVLPAITYWLMGSLNSIRTSDLIYVSIPVAAGLIPLLLLIWKINLLTIGEEEARSMGINTGRLRVIVILCATLLTAASVSVSGLIGWVGLVIPHFCRMIFGYDYSRLLLASAMFGAAFLVLVDDAARLIAASEVPIGILTAFIGAPVFVFLLVRGGLNDEE